MVCPPTQRERALMCYASGVDEAEAVRETVAILKQADMAPLDVTGYGTLDERLEEGHDINEEERALMGRALQENAVIVAQVTSFFRGVSRFETAWKRVRTRLARDFEIAYEPA